MVHILEEQAMPSRELASLLFPDSELFPKLGGQRTVPFLGAGASLRSVSLATAMDPPTFPSKGQVETVLTDLGFQDQGRKRERTVVLFALALAYLMIHSQSRSGCTDVNIGAFIEDNYPPSAGQLADLFSTRLNYNYMSVLAESLLRKWPVDWNESGQEDARAEWLQILQECFGNLIEVARLQGVKDGLTSIAALYENSFGREFFCNQLATIFHNKKTTTKTHHLVARAAKHHLTNVPSDLDDLSKWHYLVVTTNYDCLIEEALGDLPWVVLYFKKINPKDYSAYVSTRFSPPLLKKHPRMLRRHENMFAEHFTLDVDDPMVIIFKVHGSLFPDYNFDDDSIVITDFDYEDYIAGMGTSAHLLVPSAAGSLMHGRNFLFLGYSLNDWNIRTILTAIMRKRSEGQTAPDYAVMKESSKSAEAYCTRRDITILQTTLDVFADEIAKYLDEAALAV